jgi:hypothetical protein
MFRAIKTGATKVALTLSSQTSELETVIRSVHFDVLHLAAGVDGIQVDQVAELKRRHPGLRMIRTIPVIGPEAASAATAFEDVRTSRADQAGRRSTGQTRDGGRVDTIPPDTVDPCGSRGSKQIRQTGVSGRTT